MDNEKDKVQGENLNQEVSEDQSLDNATAMDMETFSVAPGETPVMTGVPRSNIEQAAAMQAARKAVEEEERKKNNPAIIIGGTIAFIIIVVSAIFVVQILNDKKSDPMVEEKGKSYQSSDEDFEEEIGEVKRVGSVEHGYVDVPKSWKKVTTDDSSADPASGIWIYYKDEKEENDMMLDSHSLSDGLSAEQFANTLLQSVKADSDNLQPQLVVEKHGECDMYKIYNYVSSTKTWVIRYVFEADDERVHYIAITSLNSAAPTFESIPNSWSLEKKK